MNDYLMKNLGFNGGIKEEISGIDAKGANKTERAFWWFGYGGEQEDIPSNLIKLAFNNARNNNHFHNPLVTWENAGLNDYFGPLNYTGQSLVLWAQNPNQHIGGEWSWQDARQYYYIALTGKDFNGEVKASTQTERERYYADTFRAVGQQMHLVQDVSVPSHTRNDIHALFAIEGWVEALRNDTTEPNTFINMIIDDKELFDKSVLNLSQNPSASIPIARIVDTDKYTGDNPDITTSTVIGIAEYANANFLSEDTAFTNFTYPGHDSVQVQDYPIQDPRDKLKTVQRAYYKKIKDGETNGGQGYKLATVGFLTDYSLKYFPAASVIARAFERPNLDAEVYRDYASLLLPRAADYSAGLLDYFFRGNIEITLPQSAVYSVANTDVGFFNKITLLARNITSNNEQMDNGSIELVARYRVAQEDPFQSEDILVSHDYSYTIVPELNNIRSIPRDSAVELTFDLGQTAIIPKNAVDVSLQVVYKGRLGNEDDAVAVGMKSVSDPTPVDMVNNMDKICLNGSWYDAGSAEAIAQVDPNHDGIPSWDIYLHNIADAYVKISTRTTPINASPMDYTLSIPLMQPGYLYRGYILSDMDLNHSEYATAVKTTSDDTWTHAEGGLMTGIWPGTAIKAPIDTYTDTVSCAEYGVAAPCAIRRSPGFYSFRGLELWGPLGVIFDNPEYPVGSECPWEAL
ncbi:MAG: hypothetical protein AB1480_04630 [Nitrospirota bacterium]